MAEVFPAAASNEPWWLPVNVVLVQVGDTTVLIDTGLGPLPRDFMPEAEARLPDELARVGAHVADVDVVVHTHLHVDHVGWDGSFPNARYVVHEDDWAYFMSEESLATRPHLELKVKPLHEWMRASAGSSRQRRTRRPSNRGACRFGSVSSSSVSSCSPPSLWRA
jgi:glyoxylase-like metal-dependent hydrolase (beta-lactamase superfamily II)